MKTRTVLLLLLMWLSPANWIAAETDSPQRVRVGADIRWNYSSCIDYWTPIAEHLSRIMPDCRFVIVPIASHQDLLHLLETDGLDFMSLDPAMELIAEDRFGVAPLATMVETWSDDAKPRPANAASGGAVVRRADRKDIQRIEDLRKQRIAAVKPWSLTGWIAQWGLLVNRGVDPQKDAMQVGFLGSNGDVIKSVFDGTADVGVVDADMLFCLGLNRRIPDGSLCIFDEQGIATPLALGKYAVSTTMYPGRFFSKAATTPDDLAKRVADVLAQQSLSTALDGMPCTVRWTTPSNASNVRRLLLSLMGPAFAESPGYPLPYAHPAWLYPALCLAVVFAGAAVFMLILRRRYARQNDMLMEELQTVQRELAEVRAERQRINAILAMAGCGIDIIDEHNRIVYADAGLEKKYGDWRGKKCHGYYCNSDAPCSGCKMPGPTDEPRHAILDLNGSDLSQADDPHAKVHFIEGEATRMIGIPFRDESGRWLYARIHFPLAAFSGESNATSLVSLRG